MATATKTKKKKEWHAVLTISDWGEMTDYHRDQIARWLHAQARFLLKEADDIDPKIYRARHY